MVEKVWEEAQRLIVDKLKILEDFSRAYLAETGLKPSEIVMVWQDLGPGNTKIWFEKKTGEEPKV
jgi:hypothetical protein